MKKLVALLIVAALVACEKDKNEGTDKLTGKWELRKQVGGIYGTLEYPAGNGNVMEFKSDGTFSGVSYGTPGSGTYTLQSSNTAGEYILTIKSQNGVHSRRIRVDDRELVYVKENECCDFPDTIFERL